MNLLQLLQGALIIFITIIGTEFLNHTIRFTELGNGYLNLFIWALIVAAVFGYFLPLASAETRLSNL